MYYVYILRCRGGSLYTGIAADIKKRLRQHLSGGTACAKYTRSHPPEALAALWQVDDHRTAAQLEAWLKQLPHERKRALVAETLSLDEAVCGRMQGAPCVRLSAAQTALLFQQATERVKES